jgi:hypothetical protein
MSGTVLPNTTWKAISGSTGAAASPLARANSSDENSEKRGPYSAV